LPTQLLDGAYGGPVVEHISWSDGGSEPISRVDSGYRIIEIVNGAIHVERRALNKNGPFNCWIIEPGSQFVNASPSVLGVDPNLVMTIIDTESLSYKYVAIFALDIGSSVTGEGLANVTHVNNAIDWNNSIHMSGIISGQVTNIDIQTEGTLRRLGENGTVPYPDGMNGNWFLLYDNGAIDLIFVENLRVKQFADFNGVQFVAVSDPVSSSTNAGDGVFFSFEAETLFGSDPVLRTYTITFRGLVAEDGTIPGQITFKAAGKEPIVLDIILERDPSPNC